MTARTQKSLLLTYHRVTDDDAVTGFYDVPVSRFRDHVARVAAQKGDMQIVFTFDDGTSDHLRAAEILADHGLKGVFFLVWDRLNQPGSLTHADVTRLAELDQIVASHTITHRQLPTLSDADLATELKDSREKLEALSGRQVTWFAPPGGHYDARSLPAAQRAGYAYVRTMDWGYAPPLAEAGVGNLLPTVPVLRNMSERRLEDVLGGRANFQAFALKQFARKVLPGTVYTRMRNWTMRTT